jgi:uncharacterized protein YecT (DUF1311 family)
MYFRLVLAITCCCLLPPALQAEEAKAGCYDKAQTQFDLNSCAGEEYAGADAELNRVYKAVLEKYKGDSKFIEKFREAQRAWLKYRDAEFEAKFPYADAAHPFEYYGSVFPMCAAQFRAQLTRERIVKLRERLDDSEEGDVCPG